MTQKDVCLFIVAFLAVPSLGGLTAIGAPSTGAEPPAAHPTPALKEGVQITEGEGKLVIAIGGRPFAEYHYQNVPKPFLFPVLDPEGRAMTRQWPMREAPGEEQDHIHHRSIWYSHGDVNGQDFWSESAKAGKTVHQKFERIQSGGDTGEFRSLNQLVAKDGKIICTDERTYRFYSRPRGRQFDFEITVHASEGPVTFGDTKEGTMAVRLAESMRLKGPKGKPGLGHIVNSEGVRDDATWGKRARWCDYYGPVDGKTVGLAIFDHPRNPRHPTWWHVRDYGLFAANPFGVHDFEKKPAGTGNLLVPAGASVTFRYRIYIHEGDEKQAKVADEFQRYITETSLQSPGSKD